jgi:MFS family permease
MIGLSSIALVQQYFNRRRAIASALSVTGFSAGALVAGPVIHALLEAYAWRGTLVIMAGIFLQVTFLGSLLRAPPYLCQRKQTREKLEQTLKTPSDRKGLSDESILEINGYEMELQVKDGDIFNNEAGKLTTASHSQQQRSLVSKKESRHCKLGWFGHAVAASLDFSLLRRVPFVLYSISTFLLYIGVVTFFQHMPSRAAYYNVEPHLIALLPTLTGAATGVSRLVFGLVAKSVDRTLQFGVCVTLSAVVQMTIALATTFETMAVYVVLEASINGTVNSM